MVSYGYGMVSMSFLYELMVETGTVENKDHIDYCIHMVNFLHIMTSHIVKIQT